MVILQVGRLLLAAVLAFGVGKLVARLGLPSILGWLITGMALGPHALGLLQSDVLWIPTGSVRLKAFWNVR